MAATRNSLRDFVLTPQQQSLLFAALNSNKQATEAASANNVLQMSPNSLTESPAQTLNSVQESPFQDYDYDFENGDSSFDYPFENNDQLKMIGDLPGGSDTSKSASPEGDSPDKRGHPDDEDGEPGNKRRESEEKVAKKPGRKPLTSEPSSKRKAQNRAAQRAFRERKEKHLKDLEEKVGELQKASEQTSSENSALRAKVEKMTVELDEYKKRLAVLNNNRPSNAPSRTGFGNAVINNLNDVNFQFEFPKFGTLPGGATPGYHQVPKRLSSAPSFATSLSRTPSGQISPKAQTTQAGISPSNSSNYSQIALDAQTRDDIANYSTALFGSTVASKELPNGSRGSFDSQPSLGGGTNTSSPSASSSSNVGPSSSAGTSPEPFTQSPMGFKPLDTMTTIGEEQPSGTGADEGSFPVADELPWLASQNNFQFDPQLFGDYRESQDSVLGGLPGLDDTFFNDAFAVDFTTPYNMAPSPVMQKKVAPDLMAQIDAAKNKDEVGPDGQLLTCNTIWEKLQGCSRVQSGDFDLDGLCAELQSKAKCSGNGPAVNEKDFKHVMRRYLGKTEQEMAECDVAKAAGLSAA